MDDVYSEMLGPFYTIDQVASLTSRFHEEIEELVNYCEILEFTFEDKKFYPTWQFNESGETIPAIVKVSKILFSGNMDANAVIFWLCGHYQNGEQKRKYTYLFSDERDWLITLIATLEAEQNKMGYLET